jgi:hypothetical protein
MSDHQAVGAALAMYRSIIRPHLAEGRPMKEDLAEAA